MTRILNVVGCKNAGKTRTVEMLVPRLKKLGIVVGTLKHTEHNKFHWDREGTDTYRHHNAGSDVSGIFGSSSFAFDINYEKLIAPSVDEIVKTFYRGLDLVIVEGCKTHPALKIEVCRPNYSLAAVMPASELLGIYGENLFPRDVPYFGYGNEDDLAAYITTQMNRLMKV